jgi:hypothetical protein
MSLHDSALQDILFVILTLTLPKYFYVGIRHSKQTTNSYTEKLIQDSIKPYADGSLDDETFLLCSNS